MAEDDRASSLGVNSALEQDDIHQTEAEPIPHPGEKDGAMGDPISSPGNENHHSHKHLNHLNESFQRSLRNIHDHWSPDLQSNPHIDSHPHARWHDYRESRDRLFINGFSQSILDAYSRKHALDTAQKHAFNALMTGFSIALGINLASSLRSYANLLRWRLLASAWLTLEEFDLVLSCSSQIKTLKLLAKSRLKTTFPFISLLQFLCFIWIFVNLGVQVLVAMLGLTYSLQLSEWDLHRPGFISVADLSSIRDIYGDEYTVGAQQFAAHAYGVQGQDYDLEELDVPVPEDQKYDLFYTVYANYTEAINSTTDTVYDQAIYYFTNTNSNDSSVYTKSDRYMTSDVSCYAYNLFQFDPKDLSQNVFNYSDGTRNQSLFIPSWSPGAVTYISSTDRHYCGARCIRVFAFQAQQQETYINEQLDVSKATLFDCNNTISHVLNGPLSTDMPDEQAQIIAGAAGWTGFNTSYTVASNSTSRAYSDYQYTLFSPESQWSPQENMPTYGDGLSAAGLISQYSMYAVAAIDNNGPTMNISTSNQPEKTERVFVEWRWAIPLLGVIPAIQFLALLAVVLWANKAVIKDDSFLAAARLLKPLVDRLPAGTGSVLTGREIAEAIQARDPELRVFYGFRPSESAEGYMKVDVIEKGQGWEPKISRAFVKGHYL
ncbi:MAG: hypothetical protein Q9227_001869 [Pyrenula ochraceoflavens]